jgi:thiol:disulfide interchange protein DsbD
MDPSTANALLATFEPEFAGGGAAAYAWAFGQGVLVDFTPCVYPLIPITVAVFGAKGVSRGRALFLASAYVLGMAALYTALGVLVASTGSAFGAWLAKPAVVLPIVALMVALAASMFGAFDLQLPTSMQNRLNTVGGAGPVGAFLMGLVSGLISAPCTGPVLLSLLAYIAQSSAQGHGLGYGASLLFTYALGMGTLFFAVALGASLFKPGAWMEHVKSFFGIVMLLMAFWFLRPLSNELADFVIHPQWGLAIGLGIVGLGVGAGAIHLSFHGSRGERMRKAVAVAVTVFGGAVALNAFLYVDLPWKKVHDLAGLERALAEAETTGKPVLVDFSATYCAPCKELELQTFTHPSVEPILLERFELVKIDVSEATDDHSTMQEGFASETLPSVLVYASAEDTNAFVAALRAGRPLPEPAVRFRTFVEHEPFRTAIDPVK